MISLKTFGSIREEIGESIKVDENFNTVSDLKENLSQKYPHVQWSTIAFAVNKEYAEDETKIHSGDEIALIPPVSGG